MTLRTSSWRVTDISQAKIGYPRNSSDQSHPSLCTNRASLRKTETTHETDSTDLRDFLPI